MCFRGAWLTLLLDVELLLHLFHFGASVISGRPSERANKGKRKPVASDVEQPRSTKSRFKSVLSSSPVAAAVVSRRRTRSESRSPRDVAAAEEEEEQEQEEGEEEEEEEEGEEEEEEEEAEEEEAEAEMSPDGTLVRALHRRFCTWITCLFVGVARQTRLRFIQFKCSA